MRFARFPTASILLACLVGSLVPCSARGDAEAPPEPSPASAEMLKSMREKNILTEEEYEDLYRRQAMYEARQKEAQKLPGWLDNWTFGGDLRLRTDVERFGGPGVSATETLVSGVSNVNAANQTAASQRVLPRLSLRIGAEKQLGEDFTVGFRIATSQAYSFATQFSNPLAQPISTGFARTTAGTYNSPFADLGDFFSLKSLFLDRGYLRWTPGRVENLEVIAGKFENPFLSSNFSGDIIMWDHDIQPEGAAISYRFDAVPGALWLDTKAGMFVVDRINFVTTDVFNFTTNSTTPFPPQMDDRTPFMIALQGGLGGEPAPWLRAGARFSYYQLIDLDQRFSATIQDLGNGGGAIRDNPIFFLLGPGSPYFQNGNSTGRMEEIVADAYATLTPFGDEWPITPFFQWMSVISANDVGQNIAYGAGFDVGIPEILRLSFLWATVQRNGTIALFTDSDLFDGFTNARGYQITAERNLTRAVRMRVAYFSSTLAENDCAAVNVKGLPSLFCDTTSLNPLFADYRRTSLDRWRLQVDLRVTF